MMMMVFSVSERPLTLVKRLESAVGTDREPPLGAAAAPHDQRVVRWSQAHLGTTSGCKHATATLAQCALESRQQPRPRALGDTVEITHVAAGERVARGAQRQRLPGSGLVQVVESAIVVHRCRGPGGGTGHRCTAP